MGGATDVVSAETVQEDVHNTYLSAVKTALKRVRRKGEMNSESSAIFP